jgi:hypothetical protein
LYSTPWLLLDTETTGFKPPIYVVELAAQLGRSLDLGYRSPRFTPHTKKKEEYGQNA